MTFTTPHGTVRYRLPWSWSAFDYRDALRGAVGAVRRRALRDREGRRRAPARRRHRRPHRPRRPPRAARRRRARLAARARDARTTSRPTPRSAAASRSTRTARRGGDDALDVWVERDLVRRGYGWRVPAGAEARIGVGSYDPRRHVKAADVDLARAPGRRRVRYQGNWFPHRLRAAVEDGVFFAGDSAGHCFPLSGEGIRTAFYFGIAAGREIATVVAGEQSRDDALRRYAAFHERHRPAFRRALALQRLVPALPPRALTVALRALAAQPLCDRAFGWYLDQAHPAYARAS